MLRSLKLSRKDIIRARKILGRKKTLSKYPAGTTIDEWEVRFSGGYTGRLSIRNEDRPNLYFGLMKNRELLYEVEDHTRSFGGEYPLYTEDDNDFRIRIREEEA